ncbi:phosphonate ABC transporter, permease protein PhnE [Paenibacillus thalictri]|uniref:Phosphonate ABC transporter, permease protein PhnE n=1 Tax=Paenibacillus thalictri TaxID=2527873 RepID=A0A4Q9DHU7_9BACL|nr:phosphonate ABC transporter, permease protein PhnE [Paenibacillus thalictri]TBL70522.1 phosphonate ABC transporter, permease protein PhnE [Paenibacillus thalictri]
MNKTDVSVSSSWQARQGERLEELHKQKKRLSLFIALLVVGITVWSAAETGFSITELAKGSGEIFRFIFFDFLPPDFTKIGKLIGPALDTIYISFVAMAVGAFLSMGLAFFGASTTSPHPALQMAVRAFCSVMRNIPTLIWGILFVVAYGLGTLVGTLALIVTSIGTLTRAYAEMLEEIDMGQVEALRATGASYIQVLAQAVWPQFLPGFIGWSLYKLELNVRASTLIGMVGGGGLGFAIQKGLKLFQFKEVSLAILMVMALVLVTEWITSKLRERIL